MKETITATAFLMDEDLPSKLAPGEMARCPDILIGCPRCAHAIGKKIYHGQTVVCGNCDLSITLWGNSLEIVGDPSWFTA